jgi:hypothetical protein
MMDTGNSKSSIVSPADNTSSMPRSSDIVQNQITTESDSPLNASATSNTQNNLSQVIQTRIAEHFIIVWLNLTTNYSPEDMNDSISKLQYVVNSVKVFTVSNECMDFLTNVRDEKVFMVISEPFEQSVVPRIHDNPQVHSVYIFNHQQTDNQQWTQQYPKVKGVFAHIESICDPLKLDVSRLMVNLTPFSIVSTTSSPNLGELDQSFMYTQLIKEIILDIKYDAEAKEQFVQFCLNSCANNDVKSRAIKHFQQCYEDHTPIWWYAREWFIYSTINEALRTQDTEMIINMGFFIRDLYQAIEQRHPLTQKTTTIIIYRGQGMSTADFEKLKKTEGSLLAFNSFLSTSANRKVASGYADCACQNRDTMGI